MSPILKSTTGYTHECSIIRSWLTVWHIWHLNQLRWYYSEENGDGKWKYTWKWYKNDLTYNSMTPQQAIQQQLLNLLLLREQEGMHCMKWSPECFHVPCNLDFQENLVMFGRNKMINIQSHTLWILIVLHVPEKIISTSGWGKRGSNPVVQMGSNVDPNQMSVLHLNCSQTTVHPCTCMDKNTQF